MFGLANGLFGGGFLIYRVISLALASELDGFSHPSFILHGVGAGVFLVVWLLCRSGTRTRWW